MRVFLGLISVIFFALPASANELGGMLRNGELHRNARSGNDTRHDLWRLSPDGSFSGNYRIYRLVSHSFYVIEGQVAGTWRYDNRKLCIEGRGLETPGLMEGRNGDKPAHICYDLRKTGLSTSGNEYAATNTATGLHWQMFIYPRTRY